VITYDEHGGFYDHVPPPVTVDEEPDFVQLGFRVPSIVIGPHVRKGCVVKTQLEHVSVIKTLTVKHGLPELNSRVAAANDLSSCIQPAYLEDPQPPVELPLVSVNLNALRPRPASRHEHPEMWDAAERGDIPAHLDRRAQGEAIMHAVLDWGERLGAVRVKR
jgi:phospholipase C